MPIGPACLAMRQRFALLKISPLFVFGAKATIHTWSATALQSPMTRGGTGKSFTSSTERHSGGALTVLARTSIPFIGSHWVVGSPHRPSWMGLPFMTATVKPVGRGAAPRQALHGVLNIAGLPSMNKAPGGGGGGGAGCGR